MLGELLLPVAASVNFIFLNMEGRARTPSDFGRYRRAVLASLLLCAFGVTHSFQPLNQCMISYIIVRRCFQVTTRSRKPRAPAPWRPERSEGATHGARGFLLRVVTMEASSNYFRVSVPLSFSLVKEWSFRKCTISLSWNGLTRTYILAAASEKTALTQAPSSPSYSSDV